ncbi:MAG TPA: hypothetical protein VD907_00395 [Verrucomicrobiae bacterium]|nr:hypothetical protein [Verrucomicrobiae bacterium]
MLLMVTTGAGLAEVRRKLGTDNKVTFGEGHQSVTFTVEGLVAVGSDDLPIVLPGSGGCDKSRVWYVCGSNEGTVFALAAFNPNGKLLCAAVLEDQDELDPRFQLHQLFREACKRLV